MCYVFLQEPAPWTPEGKQRIEELGLTMQVCKNVPLCLFDTDYFDCRIKYSLLFMLSQYPEGYLEAQEKKLLEKEKKTDGKDVKGSKGKRKRS